MNTNEQTIAGSRVDAQLKTLIMLGCLILGVAFLLLVAQGWQLFKGVAAQRQMWEYAIEAPKDEDLGTRLQLLGAAGWEIVSARRATGEATNGKTTAAYEMILRRPTETLSSRSEGLPLPAPPR